MRTQHKHKMYATLAIGLIAAPALAQNNADMDAGSTTTSNNGTNSNHSTHTTVTTTTSGTTVAGGTSVTAPLPMHSTAMAEQVDTALRANFDRLFLLKVAQGNLAEVMTGQLALKKSRNAQVRALAQRLVQEHSQANNDLRPILATMNMPLPSHVGTMHAATHEMLSRLNRERFDQQFMAAQVEAHENTITLFQQELAQGTNESARNYATRYLPAILSHTSQIYDIARLVRAPGSAERAPIIAQIVAAGGATTTNDATGTTLR